MNKSLFLAVPVLALHLWVLLQPTTSWLNPRFVQVQNAVVGEDPVLLLDITRNTDQDVFRGVTLLKKTSGNRWEPVCETERQLVPERGAAYPTPITLSWWSHGECKITEPGDYFLRTSWHIKLTPFLPRRISIDSDPFTVSEKPS